MTYAILIPTYNPTEQLIHLIDALIKLKKTTIIIVNDGSDAKCASIFNVILHQPGLIVLTHEKNKGKGAALKTGLNYAYSNLINILGVVTADGDGQHAANDIIAVGEQLETDPNSLIIGVRDFSEKTVPWRSQFGNLLTRKIFALFFGLKISDTQTGLRAIPKKLIPSLLKIKPNHYEFELEMLLKCKKNDQQIIEKKIHTIYFDQKQYSHFKPINDSFRIYLTLFKHFF